MYSIIQLTLFCMSWEIDVMCTYIFWDNLKKWKEKYLKDRETNILKLVSTRFIFHRRSPSRTLLCLPVLIPSYYRLFLKLKEHLCWGTHFKWHDIMSVVNEWFKDQFRLFKRIYIDGQQNLCLIGLSIFDRRLE